MGSILQKITYICSFWESASFVQVTVFCFMKRPANTNLLMERMLNFQGLVSNHVDRRGLVPAEGCHADFGGDDFRQGLERFGGVRLGVGDDDRFAAIAADAHLWVHRDAA